MSKESLNEIVRRKFLTFEGILIFSLSLRIVNLNLGRRWPEFEIAYPNLNIVDILISLWVIKIILNYLFFGKTINFPKTKENFIFFCLVVFHFYSFFFVTPTQEFGVDRLVIMTEMYLIYLFIYNFCKSARELAFIVKIIWATVIFQSVVVLSEILLGYNLLFQMIAGDVVKDIGPLGIIAERRVAGSMGDAVMFGWISTFLFLILFPFAILPNANVEISRKKLLWALGAVLIFGLLTMTRTALAGELLIAPLIAFFYARNRDKRLVKWIPRVYFLFLFLVLTAVFVPGLSTILSKRSTNAEEVATSLSLRISSLNVGLRIVEDFPVLGLGIGMGGLWSFNSEFLEDYIDDLDEQSQISYAGIHSGHGVIFAEMGFMGYGLYLFLLLVFFVRTLRSMKTRNQIISQVGAIGVMAIPFLFFSDFMGVSISIKHGMLYFSLILGLISVGNDIKP